MHSVHFCNVYFYYSTIFRIDFAGVATSGKRNYITPVGENYWKTRGFMEKVKLSINSSIGLIIIYVNPQKWNFLTKLFLSQKLVHFEFHRR